MSPTQSNNDRQKGSPLSGSQSGLNGSTSPSRGNGLNRTASRVSRFRSAKAVFERLSSANTNSNKIYEKSLTSDRPRGTVASRYAAAAAARAAANNNNSSNASNTSPKSKTMSSMARSQDSNRLSSSESSRIASLSQPKPQPRVGPSRSTVPSISDTKIQQASHSSKNIAQSVAKPPPKDLIDKIVLEIARNAANRDPDANCTIQDLSNCDISGIPETLDFDRCFQDVEMMTEEEARKLLSRKSDSPLSSPGAQSAGRQISSDAEIVPASTSLAEPVLDVSQQTGVSNSTAANNNMTLAPSELDLDGSLDSCKKTKVRFSDGPAEVFNTHAVEDYDRRNDDIDPVAASAEYEIEKSQEREAMGTNDDDDEDQSQQANSDGQHGRIARENDQSSDQIDHESSDAKDAEYIESLKREVALKRILEQNLRDLQSQYYGAVKELDDYKSNAESQLSELRENICDFNNKLEASQHELSDAREQSSQFESQLNDIKESSQILEKKYHRAKKIIKDMQSREQSFNRREQLYQQKLDEIEHELGVLIESIDRTIYEDGIKYINVTDGASCPRQHRYTLDAFGLIRQLLKDFNDDQSTQNPQIKQRVVSILEQKLASLMATAGAKGTQHMRASASIDDPQLKTSQIDEQNRHSQNLSYQLASHRLSQPNLPHPIGVGGQPTKLFHNINPPPMSAAPHESSPPQSVNSFPSTNSLNSLNNNNHLSTNNNNHNHNKFNNDQPSTGGNFQLSTHNMILGTPDTDKFQPTLDIQVPPYQTNEWHDKPVSEWTTTQVSTWLLALGLDQYISKFEDRNVNGQSLINLDSTVLKGLGVLNSNDRNLIKKKIRELRNEMEKERKLVEKKMKETLKDKSKNKLNNSNNINKPDNGNSDLHQSKSSWKRGLLS